MFGIHRQRGVPTYSIHPCLTPWTSHTDTVYEDTSRAAHVMFPLHSRACSLPLHRLCVLLLLCVAPPPARTAAGPYPHSTAVAHCPQVPFPALITATYPAAVLLVSRAEIRWLGYVHARLHYPSILFEGPGDAPVHPLSCSKGQRDTPAPP